MKSASTPLPAGSRPGPVSPKTCMPKEGTKPASKGSPKGERKSPAPERKSGNRSVTIR